jgi:DNA-binding LytR/AlgR family response regulator
VALGRVSTFGRPGGADMTTAPIATALVADDETGPRAQLAAALAALWPQLRIVEAGSGTDAWDAWLEHEPQVCFLDIRMPGFTGIEVAQRIGARAEIVFVSAPGEQALAAFDAAGVDCLLKPVDTPQLRVVVERVQARLAGGSGPSDGLPALLDRLAGQVRKPAPLEVIDAGAGRDPRPVRMSDVIYFETDLRATRVVSVNGEFSIRAPLRELLAELDPAMFWQIHRTAIVNRRHIAGAQQLDDGSMVLALRDRPERLPIARPFRGLFDGPVMSPAPSP